MFYRFNEVRGAQRIEAITVGQVVTTYAGTARVGSDESDAVWQIMKIVEDSSVAGTVSTSITFPNGDHSYGFVWTDRASLTYV